MIAPPLLALLPVWRVLAMWVWWPGFAEHPPVDERIERRRSSTIARWAVEQA